MDVAPSSIDWIEEISESYEAIETAERWMFNFPWAEPIVRIDSIEEERILSRNRQRSVGRLDRYVEIPTEYHYVSSADIQLSSE